MHRPIIGLKGFINHCVPEWFAMPHDGAQLTAIAKIARAAQSGKMLAVALEDGCGKSTLALATALWVTFEGIRRYPLLLCASEELAEAARTRLAAAKALETHGRACPFFEREQVLSIWSAFTGVSRPAPGHSRPGHAEGGMVQLQRPDLIILDNPVADVAKAAALDEILMKAIPTFAGPGRKTAAILLGAPATVARVTGSVGSTWEATA